MPRHAIRVAATLRQPMRGGSCRVGMTSLMGLVSEAVVAGMAVMACHGRRRSPLHAAVATMD